MIVHILFGTPFLVFVLLWGMSFTLYAVMLETGLRDRFAGPMP